MGTGSGSGFGRLLSPFVQTTAEDEDDLRLLHNLDRPLFGQIEDFLNGRSINKIQIISPFFDGRLEPWYKLQARWPDCRVEIYIQQHKSNFPLDQFNTLMAEVRVYRSVNRYLHGKAILFHTEENIYLFMGSANFTAPALLKLPKQGNFEIGVMGAINEETAVSILQPTGQEATLVTNVADIHIHLRPEFPIKDESQIEYLVEAIFKNNSIQIETKVGVTVTQFQPKRYRLVDFNENIFEGPFSFGSTIPVKAEIRKKIKGRFGIQLIGKDEQGRDRLSNLVWVIDWDERAGDKNGRRLRRIVSDPAELFHILQEITATGDERELMLFLQSFDIPLDLLLPPQLSQGSRNVKSKGNMVGTLPFHHSKFFSDNVLIAYSACLDRLLGKMKKHADELQLDKIGNFVLIFNAFLVLLDFVNCWAREKYLVKPAISGDDWLLIRNCYDMLLKSDNGRLGN